MSSLRPLNIDFAGTALVVTSLVVRIGALLHSAATIDTGLLTQIFVLISLIVTFVFNQIKHSQEQEEHRQSRRDMQEQTNQARDAILKNAKLHAEKADLYAENQRLTAQIMVRKTQEQTDILTHNEQTRHAETLEEIAKVHRTTTEAIDAANHANEKITQTQAVVAEAIKTAIAPAAAAAVPRTPGTLLAEVPLP